MPDLLDAPTMAKKKAKPVDDNRVTVANIKGTESERDWLNGISDKTGVSISKIIRRGVAMWAKSRGLKDIPANWIGE